MNAKEKGIRLLNKKPFKDSNMKKKETWLFKKTQY